MEAPPVQYVTTSDGYNIAYAVSGEGPAFVIMPWPASHIQLHWTQSSYVQPWLTGLANRFRLIQYDSRGQGMSSRGLHQDFMLTDYVRDLDAVVERLQVQDFVLMAINGIGHEAIHYAIENAQRVRALILASPVVEGSVWPQALWGTLAEHDWDAFLRNTALLARADDMEEMVGRLRQAVTQSDWLAWIRALQKSSVEADLPRVTTPTLVIHPRDYDTKPEDAGRVASAMPNARLVTIDGVNLLGDTAQGLKAIDAFLGSLPRLRHETIDGPTTGSHRSDDTTGSYASTFPKLEGLSARQIQVLQLIGLGSTNREIATKLVLSVRTVERHVADIYAKIGVRNRSEAAVYALRHFIDH